MEFALSFLLHICAILLASFAFLRLFNQFKLCEPQISSFFIRISGSLILSLSASYIGVLNPPGSANLTAQDQVSTPEKYSASANEPEFVSKEGF